MRKPGPPKDVPPPLEMLCLRSVWMLGEGNVAKVQEAMAASRPLAYTTVMTLLDRLAKKSVLSRRKVGRAFFYAPAIAPDEIRRQALKEFLDSFFDGSPERLLAFIRQPGESQPPAAGYEIAGETD
ncbi:MAG: BlaI/MecI/CopY family transcriptional regulator, partial [Bryobacteraceae bacterium]